MVIKMDRVILCGMRLDDWLYGQQYQTNSCQCAIVCDADGQEARVLAMQSTSDGLFPWFTRLKMENPSAIFRIMENREHRAIVLIGGGVRNYGT